MCQNTLSVNAEIKFEKEIPQIPAYTLETLKPLNASFDREHGLKEKDADIVNSMIRRFENIVKSTTPEKGDIIYLEGYRSSEQRVIRYRGHIDDTNAYGEDKLYCVTSATLSNVRQVSNDKISLSTGGGYWLSVEPAHAEFLGYALKEFWAWGSNGACGNGSVYFLAPVKVWKHVDHKNIY